jgi:glycosyltransferase involved in cell wall biosynthesis
MTILKNKMKKSDKDCFNTPKICLLAYPTAWGTVPQNYSNFAKIFSGAFDYLYAITCEQLRHIFSENKFYVISTKTALLERGINNPIKAIAKIVLIQIELSKSIMQLPQSVSIIFFMGGEFIIMPVLIAKITGKKIIIQAGGSSSKSFRANYPNRNYLYHIYNMIEKANFILADQIAVETESVANFLGLKELRKKTTVYSGKFVDNDIFYQKKNFDERQKLIGYIGSLSRGKGVMNFVESIPLILNKNKEIEFMIAGEGPLFPKIMNYLSENNLIGKVSLMGWLSHDRELPIYLNELKLLVLPSYSEGLPGIVTEAMACGTPVLATSVGGIPDLIIDKKTGFILDNNSPQHIAEMIIEALNYPSLNIIAERSRLFAMEKFSYETIINRYRELLSAIV